MNLARRRFLRSATGVGGVLAASLARVGPSAAGPPTGRMRPEAPARHVVINADDFGMSAEIDRGSSRPTTVAS